MPQSQQENAMAKDEAKPVDADTVAAQTEAKEQAVPEPVQPVEEKIQPEKQPVVEEQETKAAVEKEIPVEPEMTTEANTEAAEKEETMPMIEVEDITENEVKPSSDIKIQEETGDDVIPETLFDEPEEAKPAEKVTAEDAIAKAKKAVQDKANQKAKTTKKAEKELDSLAKNIETLAKDEDLRDVLEAPVAKGQKLSPEELKKQYHETLNQAAKKTDNNVNIEVKVIEN